jgi:hypothetical protein
MIQLDGLTPSLAIAASYPGFFSISRLLQEQRIVIHDEDPSGPSWFCSQVSFPAQHSP